MDVHTLAQELRGLMRQEGDLSFRYAEVARQASDEDALRVAADEAGWFETDRTFSTLKQYRSIGLAYQERGWVPERSWTAHAEAYAHPDRYEILAEFKTKRDVRRATGKKVLADDCNAQSEVLINKLAELDPEDPEVAAAVLRAAAKVQDATLSAQKERDELVGRSASPFVAATRITHSTLTALVRAGAMVDDGWSAHERQEYLDSLRDIEEEIEGQKFRLSMPDVIEQGESR